MAPLWYTLSDECTVDVCLCGKRQAVEAGELGAARCLAAAAAAAERRQKLVLPAPSTKSRMGVLGRHFVPRVLTSPVAASADAVVHLLREFIAIPSVNPDQVLKSGADPLADPNCGEFAFATRLGEKFEELGAEVTLEDCTASWMYRDQCEGFAPRLNVYAIFESREPNAKWLAIDTHLDTVMVNGMEPFGAFDATLTDDGRVHGRGACDTKATFAMVLAILGEELQKQRAERGPAASLELPVNLIVCGTAGEETGRLGANYFREFLLRRHIFVDEMLVAEPTLCTPVTGHKGGVTVQFNIDGVAAHSSKPHLGKNALVAASQLILRMIQEHEKIQRDTSRTNGPLGAPTITPTLGSGGHGPNIVPQDASVFIDYRVTTDPSITDRTVTEDTQSVLDRLVEIAHEVLDGSEHCEGFSVVNANSDGEAGNPSFFQDPESEWVRQLAEWSGLAPEVVTFGTNATAYSAPAGQGIVEEAAAAEATNVVAVPAAATSGEDEGARVYGTCVVMGPGDISQAHMADEWVEVRELQKMKGVLRKWFGLSEQ